MSTYTLQQLKDLLTAHKDAEIEGTTLKFQSKNDYNDNGAYCQMLVPVFENVASAAALHKLTPNITSVRGECLELATGLRDALLAGVDRWSQSMYTESNLRDDPLNPADERTTYITNNGVFHVISKKPYEATIDGVTYRAVINVQYYNSAANLLMCYKADDPQYNYIDVGMLVYSYRPKNTKKVKHMFYKQGSLNLYKIAYMLTCLPADAADVLQDGCFFNPKC
jgi:hypothetical protein